MGTGPLGLQGALFLGGVLDNGLGLVLADLSTLLESTAGRGAQLTGLLDTSGDGSVLLDLLLLHRADLSGPLGALGLGGVARGLILALLILDGLTGDNIILDIVLLLLGHVGGVAPPVVGVITLDSLVILSLLNHLDL